MFGFICFFQGNIYSSPQKTITLENGGKAIIYLPERYNPKKRYPLIMVLHGMRQTAEYTIQVWKHAANELNMILVCPHGSDFNNAYTGAPIDDRKNFIGFLNYIDHNYKVDFSKSLLVGFSRGGSFAIETGILYPRKFRNIVCIFGFFNKKLLPIIDKNNKRRTYRKSHFYFITGKGDLTLISAKDGYLALKARKIKSKLKIFNHLNHNYPPDLITEVKRIQKWIFGR